MSDPPRNAYHLQSDEEKDNEWEQNNGSDGENKPGFGQR